MKRHFDVGPVRFLARGYKDRPQYGLLAWSAHPGHWCADLWVHRVLFTVCNRE